VERFDVSSEGARLVGERSGDNPPARVLHGGPGVAEGLSRIL
jgi:hypothetical protein